MTYTPDQTFNDTADGVLAMLRYESELGDALNGAFALPDPYVRGCWRVDLRDGRVFIAYVSPHPYANDFEEVRR